jgi:hypothetical protein
VLDKFPDTSIFQAPFMMGFTWSHLAGMMNSAKDGKQVSK